MIIFLLMTLLFVGTAIAAGVFASATGRSRLVGVIFAATALWLCGYFGAIAWFSGKSPDRVLDAGVEKRLSGFMLDPHFIYSVKRAVVSGDVYRVTLEVRSDARSARLNPPALLLAVVDSAGRELDRKELRQEESDELRMAPGERRELEVELRVPSREPDPLLVLESANRLDRFLSRFIIDDEQSFGHKKTKFRLRATQLSGTPARETN